jgi:hypothetical protein
MLVLIFCQNVDTLALKANVLKFQVSYVQVVEISIAHVHYDLLKYPASIMITKCKND